MEQLPLEVTAPSGKTYYLHWTDDESSILINDKEADENQRSTMHPIYIRQETDDNDVVHNFAIRFRIRKLTPRETGRLMDVPEWATDRMLSTELVPRKKGSSEMIERPIISKSQIYKLHGNSIVTACMTAIFENLFYPDGKESAPRHEGRQLLIF